MEPTSSPGCYPQAGRPLRLLTLARSRLGQPVERPLAQAVPVPADPPATTAPPTLQTVLARARGCLFDLDGVLTPTAALHKLAWAKLFDLALADYPAAARFSDADYFALIDGRPRYDGVRAVLAVRGIHPPEGEPTDAPGLSTICALGNLKDALFLEEVRHTVVQPYPGSVAFLRCLITAGLLVGVVSASQNARLVLESAGLLDVFSVVIDGICAASLSLPGKPSPATYLEGARRLGVDPADCIVVEDALGGVGAARAGHFGWIIGVDRGAGQEALRAHGASIVVADLGDLVKEA